MGHGPHTVPLRALLRHAGVVSPRGRDPCGSRSSRIPPPASRSLLGGGASPRLRGGGGPLLWLPSWGGCGGGGGGAAPPPPCPVGRRPSFRCPWRAPRGILVPWGLPGGPGRRARSGRPPTGQCGGGGGEGGGDPPALVRAPSSQGRPPIRPLRLRCRGRRRSAVGRQQAGHVGACLGCGAPAPRVQRPFRGGCAAAVSSVCLNPLLGLSGRGGGSGGGPLVPWRRLLTAGGGGAALRSRQRGPAIGWGVASVPRPPLPRAGPSCRPSPGPLIPPAVVARRWPAVRVSGQRLAGCGAAGSPPRSLSLPSLPREVARSSPSCRTVGGAWVWGAQLPPPLSRVRRLGRHLRRRLCGGWGCGGGGLRRR